MSSSSDLPLWLLAAPRNPVLAVGLPFAFGYLSGFPTYNLTKEGWYYNLRHPPYEPPRQTFGIVWPALYCAMGFASHLAVQAYRTSDSAPPGKVHLYHQRCAICIMSPLVTSTAALAGLKLYYVQLALNLVWTPLFFGLKQIKASFVDIVALSGTVYYMTYTLHGPTKGKSTWLLAPYCIWLTFATYLNGGFVWLNRKSQKNPRKDH